MLIYLSKLILYKLNTVHKCVAASNKLITITEHFLSEKREYQYERTSQR